MSKERSLVRASEIGQWAFCQRAWWLAYVKQTPHQNPRLLAHGEALHRSHGRTVWLGQALLKLGSALLAMALVAGLGLLALWLWS
jgi:hypothetical protein